MIYWTDIIIVSKRGTVLEIFKFNFTKIDIVIIDGYEKYAPWTNKSVILCEFIKLCKITNKILYAGGVALEILIYYLATGTLNEYNFVNAKGQIKALEERNNVTLQSYERLKVLHKIVSQTDDVKK